MLIKTQKKKLQGMRSRPRQSGLAIAEVILLTVPLSILSLVVTSRLTAVASAREESIWRASVLAQLAAREPDLKHINLVDSAIPLAAMNSKSALVQSPGIVGILGRTSDITVDKTVAVPNYYFATAAGRMLPRASSPSAITNRANFLCNEPFEYSALETGFKAWFGILGAWQGYKMYHSGKGQAEPVFDKNQKLPDEKGPELPGELGSSDSYQGRQTSADAEYERRRREKEK